MLRLIPSISPIAMRAARSLLPIVLLTALALGTAAGASVLIRQPAQVRVEKALAAYEAARRAQTMQEASLKLQRELVKVWTDLPVRKDFPELILAISDLARKDRVAIPGMSYSFQQVEGDLALKAAITFRVAGKYAAIRRFIHRLETASSYLLVESLDATRKAQTRKAGRRKAFRQPATHVVFNIRVVTFLKLDPLEAVGRV